MSAPDFGPDPRTVSHEPGRSGGRLTLFFAGVSSAGFIGLALGLAVAPDRAALSYLEAWTFATTICLGALLLLMIGHASKAGWMVVTRRITEAVVSALPVCFVLFVPVAAALGRIYPWARHPLSAQVLAAVRNKQGYLSAAPFVARTAAYFAAAITMGSLLRAWSRRNDRTASAALVRRMRRLSGGGLPVMALVLTWSSFDWIMSIEPGWSSTIFGLYTFAGSFIGALALVCVMLDAAGRGGAMRSLVTPDHAQALGRVLFAMVCFWAYQAFSQLLIYWIGNIPAETAYYQRRIADGWWILTYGLVVGHFIVPFFALIHHGYKRSTRFLAVAGGWMLLMHYADVLWMLMPAAPAEGLALGWLDLTALAAVGGLVCGWIRLAYVRAPALPAHAPELAEGLRYEVLL